MDRRVLRRVAGALCLRLAFYCLVAAAATIAAPSPSAEPGTGRAPERPPSRLPLLIPIVFLVFLVVVAAVVYRGRRSAAVPRGRQEPHLR
jgi:hypothetical protein